MGQDSSIDRSPVIIIGAGRSGTNALRDALCAMPGFQTWPCDEINYVWRSGNRNLDTDELEIRHARPEVRRRISRAFDRRARAEPGSTVVEKTCANSLRVGFVDAVVPDARFVTIVRDGKDVTASAMQRWTAPLDLRYLARKARYVPLVDVPYYAQRFVSSRLARRHTNEGRVSTWGPRFGGLDELTAAGASLDLICATQWAACVESSLDQLRSVPSERQFFVRYERLVEDPHAVLRSIVGFAGRTVEPRELAAAAATITAGRTGAWRKRLTDEQVLRIAPIIDPVHRRLAELG